jgi:hypothetical protein
MKLRVIFRLSLAVNVLLVIGLFTIPNRPTTQTMPSSAVSPSSPTAEAVVVSLPQPPVSFDGPFHWSQIACDDLIRYRDNLRRIDCPELTVREIMLAEINERFLPRRRALLASLQDRFWNPEIILELADRKSSPRSESQRPLAELNAERQRLIDKTLGPDRTVAEIDRIALRDNFQRDHAWLPRAKSQVLFAIDEEHRQRLEQWNQSISQRPDGILTDADQARRQAIDQSFDTARKRVLTADEINELQLRESSAAGWAADIPGFEATESEWRAVVGAQLTNTDTVPGAGDLNLTPEERAARQDAADRQLKQTIRDVLGPDRFAQYELASDGAYQGIHNITERYGLSNEVALEALEAQRAAENQAAQVRNNPDFSNDQRQAGLAAISRETERTLLQTLGPQVFSTYKEYNGDWLTHLATTGENQ